MVARGAEEAEVIETIQTGAPSPAKQGRQAYRRDFRYDGIWSGRRYGTKQVLAILAEEPESLVVVTVYVFYF